MEESPAKRCEGNHYHVRNEDGNLVGFVSYFGNSQPNFMFYDAKSKEKEQEGNFFKTYLGRKGQMFWYQIGNLANTEQINLTDNQVELLKKFFRWER